MDDTSLKSYIRIFKFYFLWNAHSTEHPSQECQSNVHFTTESTEVLQIKRLAQGHNILMLPGFEPSTSVSRNRHSNHMSNMLKKEENDIRSTAAISVSKDAKSVAIIGSKTIVRMESVLALWICDCLKKRHYIRYPHFLMLRVFKQVRKY